MVPAGRGGDQEVKVQKDERKIRWCAGLAQNIPMPSALDMDRRREARERRADAMTGGRVRTRMRATSRQNGDECARTHDASAPTRAQQQHRISNSTEFQRWISLICQTATVTLILTER
jgi:hypothetical protein